MTTKFTDTEWEKYLKDHQPNFEGNPEHLRILLEEGVEGWNKWRDLNPKTSPNLKCLYFYEKKLFKSTIVYSRYKGTVDLRGINFNNVNLQNAVLWDILFDNAQFVKANLRGANLFISSFKKAFFLQTDLRNSLLSGADFSKAVIADLKYEKELTLFGTVLFKYNTIEHFRGIKLDSCSGDSSFKRFAMDQDYVETFKMKQPSWYYKSMYYIWKISSNCGRSMALWFFWSIVFVFGFAKVFLDLGNKAFTLKNVAFQDFTYPNLLYYSLMNFWTLGFKGIEPLTRMSGWALLTEVITGYIMLGGLISIFATKLARRS